MAGHEVCVKEDAFDRIERHLGEQTEIMRDIAKQGEQIIALRRDQAEDRRLIDILFRHDREQDVRISAKADSVPWYQSIPVFAALASLLLAVLVWGKGAPG